MPWLFVGIFLAASFLMIWRLESMAADGMEGTVLGSLILPYCTGMGNLIFVLVLAVHHGSGADVLTNCLVNNVTNLTLLIGLPSALWCTKRQTFDSTHRMNRFYITLTLCAVLFFTGMTLALGHRAEISFKSGSVLVGLFLLWQLFHVLDVIKINRRKNKKFSRMLTVDLILLAISSYGTYLSTDWLVKWVANYNTGFISPKHLGWLSGWLDVLPNAVLAFYYGWRRRPEIVYTSQVGDGHICIPLCIGIFALCQPIAIQPFFATGSMILIGATVVHLLCIRIFGYLPSLVGWALTAAYGVFVYQGLR